MIQIIIKQANSDTEVQKLEEIANITIDTSSDNIVVTINDQKKVEAPVKDTLKEETLLAIDAIMSNDYPVVNGVSRGIETPLSSNGAPQDEYPTTSERSID